jgi:CheY-like chemotaxis protein
MYLTSRMRELSSTGQVSKQPSLSDESGWQGDMIGTDKHNHMWADRIRPDADAGATSHANRQRGRTPDSPSTEYQIRALREKSPSLTPDESRLPLILIVARPATSRAISSALALAGYEVHRTPDANSAVDVAQKLRPQLAIVATDLPGLAGESVARLLRSSQVNLPIIMLGKPAACSNPSEPTWVPVDIAPIALVAIVAELLLDQTRTQLTDFH